jgi:hypothetical protein
MADEETTNGEPAKSIAKVTIKGPDIDITRSVDEATMGNVIALLFGAAPTGSGGRGGAGGGGGGGGGQGGRGGQQETQWDEDITLGEFISETGASTFQQKICAAGYYLMKIHGADSFTSGDVKTALADAHEDMPGNFSRDFGDAASKNYIAKQHGGEAGHFIVPKTGRTAVESHFTELPPRRRARKTAKKSSSNGKGE